MLTSGCRPISSYSIGAKPNLPRIVDLKFGRTTSTAVFFGPAAAFPPSDQKMWQIEVRDVAPHPYYVPASFFLGLEKSDSYTGNLNNKNFKVNFTCDNRIIFFDSWSFIIGLSSFKLISLTKFPKDTEDHRCLVDVYDSADLEHLLLREEIRFRHRS
jgi:hypothetical protein